MPEIFQIHDMTIEFSYEQHGYCAMWECKVYIRSLNKIFRFTDEANEIRTMCVYMDTYPQNQIYFHVVEKLKSLGALEGTFMAMYDEYYGYTTTSTVSTSSKSKAAAEKERNDLVEAARKQEKIRVERSKLGITFWGCLILQDILE